MRKSFLLLLPLMLSACELSSQQASKAELPEPGSPGAVLLKEFCSNCHAPPRPAAHSADEWANVVFRMQERRRMEGYKLLADDEVSTLVEYLQRNAKG